MGELEVLSTIATNAIHHLRAKTLSSGQPFMININGLPKDQCYLEFPDNSIQLVAYQTGKSDFATIKKLSPADSERLKRRIGLV